MEQMELNRIRNQLLFRREKLQKVHFHAERNHTVSRLLREVDAALERMENGSYGICIICKGEIEEDRLKVDPLIAVCLDDMNEHQRRMLETDLGLANRIQNSMLPQNNLQLPGWKVFYYYRPAGAVSGDYCDIINRNVDYYFILGDVSGKGIAASMLMSQLHAMFRSMVPSGLSVPDLVSHASNLLCETTISSHYATLLCVKANQSGEIEICNAGHFPPLVNLNDEVKEIQSTGMPIGLFNNAEYSTLNLKLNEGDTLLLYTDGLTEAFNNNEEYGIERVSEILLKNKGAEPKLLVELLVEDVTAFISGAPQSDDLTIMAIKKE